MIDIADPTENWVSVISYYYSPHWSPCNHSKYKQEDPNELFNVNSMGILQTHQSPPSLYTLSEQYTSDSCFYGYFARFTCSKYILYCLVIEQESANFFSTLYEQNIKSLSSGMLLRFKCENRFILYLPLIVCHYHRQLPQTLNTDEHSAGNHASICLKFYQKGGNDCW